VNPMESAKPFKMMIPTAGPFPAKQNAGYILTMAKRLRADVLVIHIRDKGESREGGDAALDIFQRVAEDMGMTIDTVPAIGEVSQTIIELAKFHNVDVIVMGATKGRAVASWIIDKILANTEASVVVIPWDYRVSQVDEVHIDVNKI